MRLNDSKERYVTDGGHYIVDLHLNTIENPKELATWLDGLTGVVEHGLFLDMVNTVIVGHEDSVEVLDVR